MQHVEGAAVETEPQKFDDDAIKREMDEALTESDDDAIKREMDEALAKSAPPPAERPKSGGGRRHHDRHHGHHHERTEEATRINGRVVAIRDKDVFIDYGGKSEGFISLDEFEPETPPQIGQMLELIPHGFDRESGQMRLSLRETRSDVDWGSLAVGDVVEARVTGTNIGGLELTIHGIRAFMPKSQVDIVRHEDFRGFVGKRFECEVTEVDRKGKNVLVSRRRVLERQREAEREQLKQQIEPGQLRAGTVRRLTDFGAFVDIGGIEGLLHISDMSYARIGHPKEFLKVGQEVQVQVLKLDLERDRISLGMKQLAQDPWELVEGNYRPGAAVDGRVVRLMDFGAFVELEAGVEGLIPVSEMSWTQRVQHPKDMLSEGDQVRVSVLAVDARKRRISLSLKALAADPWEGLAERYPDNSVISGAVTRIANFGAFIQLEEGVEGLVHISELSHERVRSVGDAVKVGEVVQCRVLGVDLEQRRISLSIKAAKETPEAAAEPEAERPQRKRDRPLRGGLSW